jgi:hypothetical protein
MPITINGSGTVTGITAGGLPDAIITQPELAANVAGNGPAFSAYGSQTISNSVATKCVLSTEIFDTNNNFDPTTNYRFTPTVSGYYQINLNHQWAAAAAAGGVCLGLLYKNGSQYGPYLYEFLDSNLTGLGASGSAVVQMNGTTDYLEVYAFQSSGLGQVVVSYFSGAMVRAA